MTLFTRNLAKCGKVVALQTRVSGIVNGRPTEVFTTLASPKAIIKTLRGKSVFDETNTERVATHELCIAYRSDITAENWVLLGTRRLKILLVENCCEANEVLRLTCTERGESSKVVNQA